MTQTGKIAFYFLCGLVLLTVLAVLGANANWFRGGTPDSLTIDFAKFGSAGVLAEIIGLFVFVTKVVIKPRTFSLIVGPPDDMNGFDIARIAWDSEKCFVHFGGDRAKVKPAQTPYGPGFEIRLPPQIFEKIADTDTIELQLVDRIGQRWEIRPFYVFQRQAALSYLDRKEQILAAYGDGA